MFLRIYYNSYHFVLHSISVGILFMLIETGEFKDKNNLLEDYQGMHCIEG